MTFEKMAATWNRSLIEQVGEMIGEDCLANGYSGLYGMGNNIHRTPYSGRNFEYYSEDGFISGQMASVEAKGIYVFMKHAALNDSETERAGLSTFANEQSIREIYLKACGMPLFALGLNIVWEFLYSIDGFFISKEFIMVQNIADMAWALCDVFILVCWFRYGKQYLPERARKYFVQFTVLALIVCAGMQLAFYLYCDTATEASIYSAFAQNVAMSVMFLTALFQRGNAKGFSLLGAVCKCIGTLTPTIWGCVEAGGIQIYIFITGMICFIVDIIYIYFMVQMGRGEK